MNIFTVIITVALMINYLINLAANWLNLKALEPELPEEFNDVFDKDKYGRAQQYAAKNGKMELVSTTFDLAVVLIFWCTGGFNWLDLMIRAMGFGEIVSGLLFIGTLSAGSFVLNLPFSIYRTFIIEAEFGFNRTTVKTYVGDLLKAILLSIILGWPLLAGILYFFQVAGEYAWLYSWGTVTVFSVIMQYVAPVVIMPLFNKFTPLEEGELREAIVAYAKKVKFPLQNIYVTDGSKRSAKSNAYFTGIGKFKRIVLYDTLIKNHTVDELVAILAHEIGHYKKKHILQGTIITVVHTGVLFYLMSLFIYNERLFNAFFMEQASVYAGLVFFSLLYSTVETPLGMIMNYLSRRNEFAADAFAAETVSAKDDMITALKKLSADNLSNLTPHPFYVFLHYSHPPVLRRISALRKLT